MSEETCHINEDELGRELGYPKGTSDRTSSFESRDAASTEVAEHLGKVVIAHTITEYHHVQQFTDELRVKHFPIVAITSVHEDTTLQYGASTELTENTHFTVDYANGVLYRIESSYPTSWCRYRNAIRIIYAGGYEGVAAVNRTIKAVTAEYAAMKYREKTEQSQNVESESNDFGTVRRYGPAQLTPGMKKRLQNHRNQFPGTWTRSEVGAIYSGA